MNKIVLGLGTGRCGTVSLSNLLDLQKNTTCKHEPVGHRATFKVTNKSKNIVLEELKSRRRDKIIGAVALNYLYYLKPIVEIYKDVHVISIFRDKESVVKSYLKKMRQNNRNANHWMKHDGKKWTLDKWDKCYPKFNVKSIEEAIEKYYDYYYKTLDDLANRLKVSYHKLQTNELNDPKAVKLLLHKIGYKNPTYKKIKKNSI